MKTVNWMKRALCVLLVALILVATAAPALAVGQSTTLAKKGDVYYVVPSSGLHVRSSASMGDNIIRTIKKGTKVVFQYEKNGWWRVKYASGKYGFVDKQYLTRSNVKKTGTYKTKGKLNMRYAPKTSSGVIRVIPKGKKVKVKKLNGDWVYVTYGGDSGWVASKYLKK